VAKGDWSYVPSNQMEELHHGGGSQGEEELDKDSDKEENHIRKRIL